MKKKSLKRLGVLTSAAIAVAIVASVASSCEGAAQSASGAASASASGGGATSAYDESRQPNEGGASSSEGTPTTDKTPPAEPEEPSYDLDYARQNGTNDVALTTTQSKAQQERFDNANAVFEQIKNTPATSDNLDKILEIANTLETDQHLSSSYGYYDFNDKAYAGLTFRAYLPFTLQNVDSETLQSSTFNRLKSNDSEYLFVNYIHFIDEYYDSFNSYVKNWSKVRDALSGLYNTMQGWSLPNYNRLTGEFYQPLTTNQLYDTFYCGFLYATAYTFSWMGSELVRSAFHAKYQPLLGSVKQSGDVVVAQTISALQLKRGSDADTGNISSNASTWYGWFDYFFTTYKSGGLTGNIAKEVSLYSGMYDYLKTI